MLRFVNISLMVTVGALTVLLYQLKYESRLLENRARNLVHAIEDERDTISVLKAEWSLLTQPERVEKLAKRHLGLGEIKPKQIVTLDWLSRQSKSKKTVLRKGDQNKLESLR